MNPDIIHQILSGKASREERLAFYEALEKDPSQKEAYRSQKKIWDIHQTTKVNIPSELKDQLFQQFWNKRHKTQSRSISRKLINITKYAAIIVLALLAGFFIQNQLQTTGSIKKIHSEQGSISSIYLEDGSRIWLNSNTTIALHESSNQTTVDLQGEAYFEVKHNPKRAFVIDLGKIKINDIGTNFNISAYPSDNFVRTTLLEGKIEVLNEDLETIKNLKINQTFKFDRRNSSYELEELDPLLVTGWKDNKFVFIDKPLHEICDEIEKWYGVTIIINDNDLGNEKYTSVIRRTTTVKQLLEMFKLTAGINYEFKNKENDQSIIYISK